MDTRGVRLQTDQALAAKVINHCRTLARFSEEPGVTTRTFLSPPMREVHAALLSWMTALGMTARIDAAGNLRGTYAAAANAPSPPTLFVGSHLDTVPNAGPFDGVLGVVIGIALIESLDGTRFPFAIEVAGFSEEEGVRFGTPFIGSRALAGTLGDDVLQQRDANGSSVVDAIGAFGLRVGELTSARAQPPFAGYLEFHIEQGPVLDSLNAPLGVVHAIVGQTRAEVVFTGASGHAGTTPMSQRRDALAAAAEWISIVEREGRETPDLVATVGRVAVEPGAGNVIPGRCTTALDVRHADDGVRRAAADRIAAAAREIAAARGVEASWLPRLDQPAVAMDGALIAALERAVGRAGAPVHTLASGAGHDAMVMAPLMPAAMLFLRSPGGLSHHPDESVNEADVGIALQAGRHFLDELAAALA